MIAKAELVVDRTSTELRQTQYGYVDLNSTRQHVAVINEYSAEEGGILEFRTQLPYWLVLLSQKDHNSHAYDKGITEVYQQSVKTWVTRRFGNHELYVFPGKPDLHTAELVLNNPLEWIAALAPNQSTDAFSVKAIHYGQRQTPVLLNTMGGGYNQAVVDSIGVKLNFHVYDIHNTGSNEVNDWSYFFLVQNTSAPSGMRWEVYHPTTD